MRFKTDSKILKHGFKKEELKVAKLSKSQIKIFFCLKFSSVFIINGSTILFSKHGKIKRWKSFIVSIKPN